MTYSELYRNGTRELSRAGISEAALDARLLLEFLTGCDRQKLLMELDAPVDHKDEASYGELIAKRAEHIPLQQLTGSCCFMGIDFAVNDKVLIPRQDSECLVEEAMRYVPDGSDILDMCTGSGAIGISIAAKVPDAIVTMADVSEDALQTAMSNAGLNGVNRRCIFLLGDMFAAVPDDKHYDVIVCNPPYIPSAVIGTLDVEVKDHEPRMALDGGKDGLDYYRVIADQAGMHLKTEGLLALEIGAEQAADVKKLLNKTKSYRDTQVIRDLAGLDRVILATRK